MEANITCIEVMLMQNQLRWAGYYMKKGKIDINAWERIAADRPLWRRSIYQKTAKFETNHLLFEAEKRQRGKERDVSTSSRLPSVWHLLPKNRGLESPQGTRLTSRRRHPPFEGPLLMTMMVVKSNSKHVKGHCRWHR